MNNFSLSGHAPNITAKKKGEQVYQNMRKTRQLPTLHMSRTGSLEIINKSPLLTPEMSAVSIPSKPELSIGTKK